MDTKFTREDGSKQQQYVCVVDYKGEERKLKLTIASCEELSIFGKDSADWIGNKVKFEVVKVMVGGKMKNSIFVTPFVPEASPQNVGQDAQPATTSPVPPTPPEYDKDGNEIAWDE